MFVRSLALVFSTLFAVSSLSAQVEGPSEIRVVLHAHEKGGSARPLQPSDLKVEFRGKQTQVTRLAPLGGNRGVPVEVALLIDDGIRGGFGRQLGDIENFVRATAGPGVALGVGYMRNGRVDFPVGFSTEPERELGAVRLTMQQPGISGSPYFCLQDLVKHWPTNTGAPRVVLMITNGIDYYNGSVSPLNQNSTYVQSAIEDVQRAGVPVYSIYYGNREISAALPSFSGQNYLSQVADETGGENFNGGQINPVSLAPYFAQFNAALHESYLLGFQASGRGLQRLKVSTKVDDVKLSVQKVASAGR